MTGCPDDCMGPPADFSSGLCGDLRYVRRNCHVEYTEFFDSTGTLVAAYEWSDMCLCPEMFCSGLYYGFRPACLWELEQELDFCDQLPELTCCHWCVNEPESTSCLHGPPEPVQSCYDSCLEDYNEEEEQSGCGDAWLHVKACEVYPKKPFCDYHRDELGRCQADSYCEANCPTQERRDCIDQYLTTGVCGV
jgi:hypothetical protein